MTEETKPEQSGEEEEQSGSMGERQQQAVDMGSSTIRTRDGTIHTLTIVGQIEGHQEAPAGSKTTKYEHVLPLLTAVEESDEVDGLLILLNTMGGDVEAGLAIAEMIAGMKTPTVSLVIGGGHSIGIPLAVCADRSMIVPSASMTVHPVRTSGLVLGVPQTVVYFEKIQERINHFILQHSRISAEDLSRMMLNTQELATDIGTVISGAEAAACGLIDQIGTLHDAIEALYHLIETREPRYPE